MKTGRAALYVCRLRPILLNASTIDFNGPARLSRKTTGQSPWRTTRAGKRQVKNKAQSSLVVIRIICGPETRTLEPLKVEPLSQEADLCHLFSDLCLLLSSLKTQHLFQCYKLARNDMLAAIFHEYNYNLLF